MRLRKNRWWTRLDDPEQSVVENLREKTGLSKEAFVRQMLMQGYIKESPPVEYLRLVAEVNKIGVNINQIARIENSNECITADSVQGIKRLQKTLLRIVKEGGL